MTVPIEPEGASPSHVTPSLLAEAVRLVALALPMTLLILFVGTIWVIGAVIPPAHANSQKTGRQAIAMIRIMSARRTEG